MDNIKLLLARLVENYINYLKSSIRSEALQESIDENEKIKSECHYKMKNTNELKVEDFLEDLPLFNKHANSITNYDTVINKIRELNALTSLNNETSNYVKNCNLKTALVKDDVDAVQSSYYQIFKKLENAIEHDKDDLSKLHEEHLNDSIVILNTLLTKINNNLPLSENEYEIIQNLMNNSNIGLEDRQKWMINLYLINSLFNQQKGLDTGDLTVEEDEEDIEENTQLLTDDQLRELFNKYHYNYELVRDEDKELMKKLGKLQNMEAIFKVLQDNDIRVEECHISKNFPKVLIYSNDTIVSTIIKNIKINNMGITLTYSDIFNIYLKNYNLFIKGHSRRDNDVTIPSDYIRNGEQGLFGNYEKILEFLKAHMVNIGNIDEKCPTLYETTHYTIKNSYAKLKSYGMSDDAIFNSAKCLSSADPYSNLDEFIELGLKDYIQKYPAKPIIVSRLYIKELLLAKKLGLPLINNDGKHAGKLRANDINRIFNETIVNGLDPILLSNDIDTVLEEKTDIYLGLTDGFDEEEKDRKKIYDKRVNKDTIYIDDPNIMNNPYIKELENTYRLNEVEYDISGITISRRKVIRIFGELTRNRVIPTEEMKYILFYSITYTSLLNQEEIDRIKGIIDDVIRKVGGVSLGE